MEKSITELINEIQQCRCIIQNNSQKLTHIVLQMSVKDAVKEGLVKFSFPAPKGLTKHIKNSK